MNNSMQFWREESDRPSEVTYLPRNPSSTKLCALLGLGYIVGERAMDRVIDFMDEVGIPVDFYETKQEKKRTT